MAQPDGFSAQFGILRDKHHQSLSTACVIKNILE